MSAESTFLVGADAHHRVCLAVKEFIDRHVQPVVGRAVDKTNPMHRTCDAYLERVRGWLGSLAKLDQPSDFQAIDAAARSLFEIVVDLTLLRFDTDSPVEKMLDWELSAKLKRAKDVVAAVEAGAAVEPAKAALNRWFVQHYTQVVDAQHLKWAWPKHPPRWSGRNLFIDAERCDRLTSSKHAQRYRLRFTELCWNTHGSAFAGIRGLDAPALIVAVAAAREDAAVLARAAAEHVLAVVDRFDDSMVARFERLDRACSEAKAGAFAAAQARASTGDDKS